MGKLTCIVQHLVGHQKQFEGLLAVGAEPNMRNRRWRHASAFRNGRQRSHGLASSADYRIAATSGWRFSSVFSRFFCAQFIRRKGLNEARGRTGCSTIWV